MTESCICARRCPRWSDILDRGPSCQRTGVPRSVSGSLLSVWRFAPLCTVKGFTSGSRLWTSTWPVRRRRPLRPRTLIGIRGLATAEEDVRLIAKKMSSGAGIRGIRRKKSSLSEVKIAIIGAPGVGKSGKFGKQSIHLGNVFSKMNTRSLSFQLWLSDFWQNVTSENMITNLVREKNLMFGRFTSIQFNTLSHQYNAQVAAWN